MTRGAAWIFVLAILAMMPAAAFGQSDVEERREEAKKLADSAYDLMQKGLYPEAISVFRKADQKFHSPVFRVYISDCQDKLGKLVAARGTLEDVIDEKLAEYAPDSFRRAQNDARERLVALDKRIPTVTIKLDGAAASVELDGKAVPQEGVGKPIRVDPGSHTAAATGSDGRSDKKTVKVEEGDRADVTLVIPGSATATTTDVPDPAATAETPREGRSYIPAAVAFGVGGAGVLLGAIAGGLFVSRADELKDACANDGDGDDQTCPDEGEIDEVKLLGNVATAGWIIAGVGTVAGVILLFVPAGDDEHTTVRVTPTGVSIQGRF